MMRSRPTQDCRPASAGRAGLLAGAALFLAGCDQVGEQASRAVEQRVQQEANKLVDKALGSVDQTLDAVTRRKPSDPKAPALSGDPSLQAAGMAPTQLHLKAAPEPCVSVYFTFEKAGESTLEARYRNRAGEEIGRSRQKVRVEAGDGRFVAFAVDPRTRVEDIHAVSVRRL